MNAPHTGQRILCTFPGRYGDLLWALPTVRAISEAVGHPVDLLIAGEFQPLVGLLTQQPYLNVVTTDPQWALDRGWRPPEDLISTGHDRIIHLGYRGWPDRPLPQYVYEIACRESGLVLPPLDLARPWITVDPFYCGKIVGGWSDCWFELKVGLLTLLRWEFGDVTLLPAPGSRWVTEYRPGGEGSHPAPDDWLFAAEALAGAKLFLGDCSALHVLAVALGTPAVLVEPMEARWDPIFWPLGMDGPQVRCVKGLDGRPTFDARHVAETLREVLGG